MRSASLLFLIVTITSLFSETYCHAKSDISGHHHAGQTRFTSHNGSTRSRTITTPTPRSHTWTKLGTAPLVHPAAFKMVLRGEHFSQLEEKMADIALSRGEWLTSSQLDHYVRPSSEALHAVQQWLTDHGMHAKDISFSRADSVLAVRTDTQTVAKVRGLLRPSTTSSDGLTSIARRPSPTAYSDVRHKSRPLPRSSQKSCGGQNKTCRRS